MSSSGKVAATPAIRSGREAAMGPGMAEVAYGPASAAADLQVEGLLPFKDGCMSWGAAAEAQRGTARLESESSAGSAVTG